VDIADLERDIIVIGLGTALPSRKFSRHYHIDMIHGSESSARWQGGAQANYDDVPF